MSRRRDRPLKRRDGSRPERQRFLIYCEGSVTEEWYIKGLKRELRAGTVAIKIGAEHGEPYQLVKAAIEHKRRAPQQAVLVVREGSETHPRPLPASGRWPPAR